MFGFFRRPKPPEEPPAVFPNRWRKLATLLGPRYRLLSQLTDTYGWNDWLAQENGRQVVVSVWPEFYEANPEALQRLTREADGAARLRHPNIVPILDYGSRDGWWWWIRPWQAGLGLSEVMGEPVDPELADGWLRQLLAALSYAHGQGVVHRRLDTQCLWVEGEQLRVGDFGFVQMEAQIVQVGSGNLPSPRFMAPEQITGGSLTPAANFFSLGALAYELFSGRPAFEGEDPIRVIFGIIQGERPSMEGLPTGWAELVPLLLAPLPADRPASEGVALGYLRGEHPSESGQEMLEVLADLRAEGQAVAENEVFTLDPASALLKLSRFRFPDPWEWLVSLCAAAAALGAEKLTVNWKQGRLFLVYQGVRLDLEDFWLSAYSAHQGGKGYLARGLAAFLTQHGGTVEVASSGRKIRTQQVQKEQLSRAMVTQLHVRVDCAEPDWGEVRRRFPFAVLPICWSGRWQSTVVANQPTPLEGFSLRIDLLETDQWLALVDGVSFSMTPLLSGVGQVVVWGPLRLDADRRNLLEDEQLATLRSRLRDAVEGAIEEFARRPLTLGGAAVRLYGRALALWKERGETREVDRFAVAFVNFQSPSEEGAWPLAQECFLRVAGWETPPEKFWQLACRAPWFALLEADWERALRISQRAFVKEHARLHWLLQCWLEWGKIKPDQQQMGALFYRFPEQRLDARFDGLLVEQLPEGAPLSWLHLLPKHWTQSRLRLRRKAGAETAE
ncbi:hypothetical protein ABS71_08355 [bacterium SCN 62-11]|nr:protein kinase [Candidatus Eremiobacteraeota bacterium]ODT70834.1 MAG: hypothetical protein ABS71_08355 [bacterium SCN 62-11]